MFNTVGLVCLVLSLLSSATNAENCVDLTKHPSFALFPQFKDCGANTLAPRIMGGKKVHLGEFPFMVRLIYRDRNFEIDNCVGTIINHRYILTVAHCQDALKVELVRSHIFSPVSDRSWVARLGDYDLSQDPDCDDDSCAQPVQEYAVDRWIRHETYRGYMHNPVHDIALVRLSRDIQFTNFVSPVCLPWDCSLRMKSLTGEQNTLAVGWGESPFNESTSVRHHILQKVSLPVISTASCRADYQDVSLHPGYTPGVPIQDTLQICAGGSRGRDKCGGDSGVPLLYPEYRAGLGFRNVQIGIASFGQHCVFGKVYQRAGVYTRVTAYLRWILQHVRK